MNGIGTFGYQHPKAKPIPVTLDTFEAKLAENTLAIIRANDAHVSAVAWKLEDAMHKLRRAKTEDTGEDEAAALRDVFAAYCEAEAFMAFNFAGRVLQRLAVYPSMCQPKE